MVKDEMLVSSFPVSNQLWSFVIRRLVTDAYCFLSVGFPSVDGSRTTVESKVFWSDSKASQENETREEEEMTFGEAVKFIRTRAGLNMREFGESIGVTHVSLHHVENGHNNMTQKHIAKIEEVYGIDPYILCKIDTFDFKKYHRIWREYYEKLAPPGSA